MALRSSGFGSLARAVNNGSYHMVAETISILRIDSSMRQHGSVSRDLAECPFPNFGQNLPILKSYGVI
jgi:hypothetical protein